MNEEENKIIKKHIQKANLLLLFVIFMIMVRMLARYITNGLTHESNYLDFKNAIFRYLIRVYLQAEDAEEV